MMSAAGLSSADVALVSTIYDPPRANRPWMVDEILPPGITRYYSLARWALVDALRACGVELGDRVLVPELVCREVLAAVHTVGATPAFYPVTTALVPATDAGHFAPGKAILAVNYFGFPQDLTEFRAYCARTGAALIEDNAHGLLSRDIDGAWLGGRGDAGIFSFRKTIHVPGGAALVVTRQRNEVPQPLEPVLGSSAHFRLKQAFRHAAGRIGPARTVKTIAAVRTIQVLTGNTGAASGASDAETRIPIAPNPPAAVTRPLTVTSPQAETHRRRALYDLVGRLLAAVGATAVYPRLPSNTVPYGFPILASASDGGSLARYLTRRGLLLAQWPDLPAAVASAAPAHYRNLRVVPFLW